MSERPPRTTWKALTRRCSLRRLFLLVLVLTGGYFLAMLALPSLSVFEAINQS